MAPRGRLSLLWLATTLSLSLLTTGSAHSWNKPRPRAMGPRALGLGLGSGAAWHVSAGDASADTSADTSADVEAQMNAERCGHRDTFRDRPCLLAMPTASSSSSPSSFPSFPFPEENLPGKGLGLGSQWGGALTKGEGAVATWLRALGFAGSRDATSVLPGSRSLRRRLGEQGAGGGSEGESEEPFGRAKELERQLKEEEKEEEKKEEEEEEKKERGGKEGEGKNKEEKEQENKEEVPQQEGEGEKKEVANQEGGNKEEGNKEGDKKEGGNKEKEKEGGQQAPSEEATPSSEDPSAHPTASPSVLQAADANGTSCNEALQRELHDHLHKVVVIMNINFGWAARKSVDFWRRLYGPIFDNIVFISTEDIPELGVERRGPAPWLWDWRNQYWGLPKIMARYPEAEGFLWTNDDVIVNYWNFLGADKAKLWLPNDPASSETRHFPYDDTVGLQNTEENARPDARRMAKKAYDLLEDSVRRQLDESSGDQRGSYQKRVCDLFYVPRRLVERFAFDVIPAYREARLYSESAIPTMFYALDHPSNWDHVLDNMVYNWDHWSSDEGTRKSYDPARRWNPQLSALHPWKISKPAWKARLVQSLAQGDSCVCREFGDLCSAQVQDLHE